MAAAAGVGAALELDGGQLVDALGIVGSMAGGIIEYLAEGTWTKRHASPAGRRNRACARRCSARAGFVGPRTVLEGVHGLFHGFAHTTKGDYDALTGDFGERWVTRDARLQALSVRDHDASLYRLRAAARRARHQGGRDHGDRLRGRRGHRAPAVGAARRQAAPAQRLCGKVLDALLHRRRLRARQCRARATSPTTRCAIPTCSRSPPRCATRSTRKSLSEQLHRPHPRRADRRPRGRGAPAAHARRRARAADPAATSRTSSCSTRGTAAGTRRAAQQALALLRTLYDGRIDLSSLRG